MKINHLLLQLLLVTAFGFGTIQKSSSESLPEINFSMLNEVRSLDLFGMELGFPESLKKLEGHRVSLVGFMAPFDNLRNMRRCMIVPNYVGCRFCSSPDLNQVVYVTQGNQNKSQLSYPYIEGPSQVSGILRLSLPDSEHDGKTQGFVYSLEDASVTAYRGDDSIHTRNHVNPARPSNSSPLEPVLMTDLVQEIAEIVCLEPLHPIKLELVSQEKLADRIQKNLESAYPDATRTARVEAYRLLGFFPEEADWIKTHVEIQRMQRSAMADEKGENIYMVDSVDTNHPYFRLQLVAEITEALIRQHYPQHRPGSRGIPPAEGEGENEDLKRAYEALQQGFRIMTVFRYAKSHDIPPGIRLPASYTNQARNRWKDQQGIRQALLSEEFNLWLTLPSKIGAFFLDSLVGDRGSLVDAHPSLARPPSTTMEFFRPRWHADPSLWLQDPVPSDFADHLLDSSPILTDVLGVSGFITFLRKMYPLEAAKVLARGWVGDRWALWKLSDGGSAMILETRWQDEHLAINFREAIPSHSLWRLSPHQEGSTRVRLLRTDSTEAMDHLSTAIPNSP